MTFVRRFLLAAALLAGVTYCQSEPSTNFDLPLEALEKFHVAKSNLTKEQGKLDSSFWHDLGLDVIPSPHHLQQQTRRRRADSGDMLVEVIIHALVTPSLLSHITDIVGGTVTFSSFEFDSITAEVPVSRLQSLAEHEDVIRVTPPEDATHFKLTTTQGAASHRVPNTKAANAAATGKGVKVGVLSDSSTYLSQVQASGDLPPQVTVLNTGTGKGEGTAMMEIVYDIAPEAQLFFSTAGTSQAQFATNIIALANRGCKVIVDDILFFSEPVYEDGPVAQAVDKVAALGVAFFSSAGNFGSTVYNNAKVYEGDYKATPMKVSNLPSSYLDTHLFGTNQPYATVTGNSFVMTLHWADQMYSPESDYDLIVTDSNGVVKTFSANGGQAYEYLTYTCSVTTTLRIYVARFSGPVKMFSLRVYGGTLSPSTKGQIYGHTAARGAFSVAAIARVTSGSFFDSISAGSSMKLESFTSQGPRRVFFQDGKAVTPGVFTSAGGSVRQKPDFTAADGALTSTPGFSTFYGTSAAAPHAAALAALAFSVKPTLTLGELSRILSSTSMDVLSAGWDDVSGHGILDAMKIVSALGSTPTAAPTSAPTTAPTKAPTSAPTTAPTKAPTSTPTTSTTTASCPTQLYGPATFPQTAAGKTATGVCTSGWKGAPTRICGANGVWQSLVQNHCVRV